jgi:hypothetical protein
MRFRWHITGAQGGHGAEMNKRPTVGGRKWSANFQAWSVEERVDGYPGMFVRGDALQSSI